MSVVRDDFARSSAARAWRAARETGERLESLSARVESLVQHPAYGRCVYCGELTYARVCRSHIDLLHVDALAPEQT